MKKITFIFSLLISFTAFAQQEDVTTLHQRATTFIRQGDYANAAVVLNQALQLQPGNTEITRELAFTQYLQKDFNRALATIKPLTDRKEANVQVFQVAGWIYRALEDEGETDKLYKKALKKFPNSAILYSDYGEMLWEKQDYS